jgi:hypothetical protein
MIKNYWILWKRGGIFLSVAFIFALAACNLPAAVALPEITSVVMEKNCSIRINYIDHVKDAGATVFLKRQVNNSPSEPIKMAVPHAEQAASFLDEGLPAGEYSYRVGYFDADGSYYSQQYSAPVTLDAACGMEPLVGMPFNPIIIRVDVGGIGGCTAQITAKVFADGTDGVRFYRSTSSGAEYIEIADLSFVEWFGGPPTGFVFSTDTYSDPNLQKGTYTYKISAYNANGEAFSDPSADVLISETNCDPTLENIPTVVPVVAVTSTPTLLPDPEPKTCIWEAAVNVFVRKGPGASLYPAITGVVGGTQFPIVGQSEDGRFWVVEVEPGLNGYVSKAEKYSRTSGDCSNTPTLQDPALPPTAIPTPTLAPREIPQCNDGIDNDSDGNIDMRDRECTNLDDKSEN